MSSFERIKPGSTRIQVGERAEDEHDYFVDEPLAEAANIAIFLQRPLVISGEAGTGKTELAYAIATQLGFAQPLEFHCKSDSIGRDVLYRVDHLRRLNDAYAAGAAGVAGKQSLKDVAEYVEPSTLLLAYQSATRRVVLIDEIDKAPPDLPNDLLDELDRGRIRIPEISATHEERAKHRPVVIITSNRERELPRPFLRRCVFHYIDYPNTAALEAIVNSRMSGKAVSPRFVQLAVRRFEALRRVPNLVKPPATGELVMWMEVLVATGVDEAKLAESRVLGALPAIQALIKRKEDLDLSRRAEAPTDAAQARDEP